jgi:hypothetical protein
MPEF